MATKRMSGGGDNLYRISSSADEFIVSQVDVETFTDTYNKIGESRSLDDTLNIVKSLISDFDLIY
mgnify:CR=1 FL=1